MTEDCSGHLSADFKKINMIPDQLVNNNDELETGEVCTPDSTHNYLAGSYRCEKFEYSSSSEHSNLTITPASVRSIRKNSLLPEDLNFDNNFQIPIVGYEVMEERARFTVYKLRVENKSSGDCWYVFRRYTDFVRLCTRLKHSYPSLALLMPRKKYFGNNFDPTFLEGRIQGLQAFVNAVITIPELVNSTLIQDFFCLNEPPAYSDTTEESRAIFEALEDTIYHLRHQLREKDTTIDNLQTRLNVQTYQFGDLKTFVRNCTTQCEKCSTEYENYKKTLSHTKDDNDRDDNIRLSTSSSSSSRK